VSPGDPRAGPRIRPAVREDGPQWGRLRRALWPACSARRNAAEMREFLGDPHRYGVFVAERSDGTVIGFVEVSLRPNQGAGTHPPVGYLEGLYVEPADRRMGLGRTLVRAAEAWARTRGCREMGSDALPTNRGSRAAHRSYGYRERERLIVFEKRLR
jgi:aminoglycoside 6'-N-acetyltransferase I